MHEIHLISNYYFDKDRKRDYEITSSFVSNLTSKVCSCYTIIVSKDDLRRIKKILSFFDDFCSIKNKSITFSILNERPTFNHFFELSQKHEDKINVICNSDIIIPDATFQIFREYQWHNYCFALSRYDIKQLKEPFHDAELYNRRDSQDTWAKLGSFQMSDDASFTMGIAGCDNKIANILSERYDVINPSLDIKTFHFHLTERRNYLNINGLPDERISPPYFLPVPQKLPQSA